MSDAKKYWVHPWESDAPEQIWIWGWQDDSSWQSQTWQHEDEPISTMKYIRADRIEALKAKLAKAVEALESVMVGGNHLAILLPDTFPPAETKPLDALEIMGAGDSYEVWCCWRSIMLARATLAELTGGKDE